MQVRALPVLIVALLPLAACAGVSSAVNTPTMSPISYPAPLVAKSGPGLGQRDEQQGRAASANSLWRNGSRNFFNDQRASKIGDILQVSVQIADTAQLANETVANRTSSAQAGFSNLFGLETILLHALPGLSTTNLINSSSALASDGKGSVNRSETINTVISAVITGVLPNGNLTIEGDQEVLVNNEMRRVAIAGIVRPQDITSTNTISNSQIAQARIEYGGKGQITQVQQSPFANSLAAKYSPF
jgi:flagellar L-ring protein precursor FlgH